MSMNFNPNEYQPKERFTPIPIGPHRARIAEVTPKTSKNGNDMIEITLDVSGQSGKLFHYIVDNGYAQQNIGDLVESCGLLDKCRKNGFKWPMLKGAVCAVQIKHEPYNGELSAKISYFIKREKQEKLPPWIEPKRNTPTGDAKSENTAEQADIPDSSDNDDAIPF